MEDMQDRDIYLLLNKWDRMNRCQQAMLLTLAYWIKYRDRFAEVAIVLTVVIMRLIMCGTLAFVSANSCQPAPLGWGLLCVVIGSGILITSRRLTIAAGVYGKTGGIVPYIMTPIAFYALSPYIDSQLLRLGFALTLPSIGITLIHGVYRLNKIIIPTS